MMFRKKIEQNKSKHDVIKELGLDYAASEDVKRLNLNKKKTVQENLLFWLYGHSNLKTKYFQDYEFFCDLVKEISRLGFPIEPNLSKESFIKINKKLNFHELVKFIYKVEDALDMIPDFYHKHGYIPEMPKPKRILKALAAQYHYFRHRYDSTSDRGSLLSFIQCKNSFIKNYQQYRYLIEQIIAGDWGYKRENLELSKDEVFMAIKEEPRMTPKPPSSRW